MKELKDLTEKAKRFLRTADLSLNDGDYDSCVSRCYYAMFFMAEALRLTENITASSHKGVITLFGKHFNKTDVMEKEMGRTLRRAYDLRQKGDYSTGFIVSKSAAKEMLEQAIEFVSKVDELLQHHGE